MLRGSPKASCEGNNIQVNGDVDDRGVFGNVLMAPHTGIDF